MPPPPPIDWATIPEEKAPAVVRLPELVTSTVLPKPPLPPLPPKAEFRRDVAPAPAPTLAVAAVLVPPMAAPPPIDCATIALEESPSVEIVMAFVTWTSPALLHLVGSLPMQPPPL